MIFLLVAWMLTDLTATYGVWHYWRRLRPLAPAAATPAAVVVVAIKGVSAATPAFLDALTRQHYPAYRLVFALESNQDPAWAHVDSLRTRLAGSLDVDIVMAGAATCRVQKVHNQLAALALLRESDQIVVFADADILPEPLWLSQLIRPIAAGEVVASTGYRWSLPADRGWATLALAAADLSVATAARSWRWNLCWGGSTAVARTALDQVDLARLWDRAATDDVTLSVGLRALGLKINAPLQVLVPSPVRHTWTSLYQFARRQYLLVRLYAPRHWLLAGWTLCVPALAALAAVGALLTGNRPSAFAVAASLVMLRLRLQLRRHIASVVLPPGAQSAARASLDFALWAWPLIHLVHTAAYLGSWRVRRFTWAGIAYRLDGPDVTVERGREPG